MAFFLLIITGLALLLSAVLGILLVKAHHAERDREAARAALLRAAAEDELAAECVPERLNASVVMHQEMFASDEPASAFRARLAAAGGVAVLAAVVGASLLPAREVLRAGAPASGGPQTLELVALHYTAGDAALMVEGVARNPADRGVLSGVTVLAFALDAGGREVARGEAPLSRATLEPGAESPFVVKMAVDGIVTRFRVRFRAADGTPLPHVDRRADTVAARGTRPGGAPWTH